MKTVIFLMSLLVCNVCYAGDLPVTTQNEINHLFAFINGSDCRFNRNGTWYTAKDAAGHIDKKYQYFLKKGKISSADDFIDLAATESSMSGKKYKVKCGESNEITSSVWLYTELSLYRAK